MECKECASDAARLRDFVPSLFTFVLLLLLLLLLLAEAGSAVLLVPLRKMRDMMKEGGWLKVESSGPGQQGLLLEFYCAWTRIRPTERALSFGEVSQSTSFV